MVPNNDKIICLSLLKSIKNILNEYLKNSNELKKSIIKKDWDKINQIALAQNSLNQLLNETMKKMEYINFKNLSNDIEISELKKEIHKKISEYKEAEKLNIKLINDLMFVTKKLIENISAGNKTYSQKSKKESIWTDKPLVYSKIV